MFFDANYPLIFSILTVHILAMMSPGPDFLLVTKNALSYSRKAGVYTALGIGLGLTIHISYSLAGLGLILTHNRIIFRVLQIIGGTYLAYIGVSSLYTLSKNRNKNFIRPNKASHKKDIKWNSALKMGFLTNLFNPKVGLFFISIFTQFFQHKESSVTKAIVATLLTLVTILYFSLVSYGITIAKIKNLYLKAEYFIEFFFALALLGLSVSVLFF
jgi:RhtB (resistance to homoserine/threonine) family protein